MPKLTMKDTLRAAGEITSADDREMNRKMREMPMGERRRGLEGMGMSPAESRMIHRAAGNDGYGVEEQRARIKEKVRTGKPLTQEDLY